MRQVFLLITTALLIACGEKPTGSGPVYVPQPAKESTVKKDIKEITILLGASDTLIISRTAKRILIANNELHIYSKPLLMERDYILGSSSIRKVKQEVNGIVVEDASGTPLWRFVIGQDSAKLYGAAGGYYKLFGKQEIVLNSNGTTGVSGSYDNSSMTYNLNYFNQEISFREKRFHPGYAILSLEDLNKYDRFILFAELLRQLDPVQQD